MKRHKVYKIIRSSPYGGSSDLLCYSNDDECIIYDDGGIREDISLADIEMNSTVGWWHVVPSNETEWMLTIMKGYHG